MDIPRPRGRGPVEAARKWIARGALHEDFPFRARAGAAPLKHNGCFNHFHCTSRSIPRPRGRGPVEALAV